MGNIFDKPQVKREDYKVESYFSEEKAVSDSTDSYSSEKEFNKFVDKLTALERGFGLIAQDYEKLITILINRANAKNIVLYYSDLTKYGMNQEHIVTLFGSAAPATIDFSAIVSILRKEQQIAAAITSRSVSPVLSIEDIVLNSGIQNNPSLAAIKAFKSALIKFLSLNDLKDFLQIIALVANAARAQRNRDSINDVKDNIANEKQRQEDEKESAKTNGKNGLEDWLRDCIPCAFRVMDMVGNFRITNGLQYFLDVMIDNLFSSLEDLLLSKLNLIQFRFSRDLCTLANILASTVCIPDLVAILALIKMMIFKLNKFLTAQFEFSLDIAGDVISALIGSITDAIFSTIARLGGTVFSSIDCIITDLEAQIEKIPVDFSLSSARKQTRDIYKDFVSMIAESKNEIDEWIVSVGEEVRKMLRGKKSKTSAINVASDKLDLLSTVYSIGTEIYNIVTEFSRMGKAADIADFLKKSNKAICMAAHGNTHPWLNAVDHQWTQDTAGKLKEAIDKAISDSNNIRNPKNKKNTGADSAANEDSANDIFNTISPDIVNIEEIIIYTDPTIPQDFFEDDASMIMTDPILTNMYQESQASRPNSIENGENDILDFDTNVYVDYVNMVETIKNLKNAISTDKEINTSTSLPTRILDFSPCLALAAQDGVSEANIREWINKVTT